MKSKAKKLLWKQKRSEVNKITDSLGLKIDEKIKEAVTAFRVHKFDTSQSCQGHVQVNNQQTATFPWIDICAPEPKDWKNNQKKQDEWTIQNLKQQEKLLGYLAQFYQSRQTSFNARLIFKPINAFGGFRIQSFGGEIMSLLSIKEQKNKLKLYQKEITDFAIFLRNKFFTS